MAVPINAIEVVRHGALARTLRAIAHITPVVTQGKHVVDVHRDDLLFASLLRNPRNPSPTCAVRRINGLQTASEHQPGCRWGDLLRPIRTT